ncbi:MAG: helix-turn-helix domain-containing protein [Chitinispirillia bacterium]|nr:helix-turn-helix domain-containing protein [Chitinispirillia bacterium]
MSVRERIRQLREALNQSQAKFDSSIYMAVGYTAKVELGKISIPERIIKLICIIHGVSENWLKTGEGGMFIDNEIRDFSLRIFDELTPENQKLHLEFAEYLLDKQLREQRGKQNY